MTVQHCDVNGDWFPSKSCHKVLHATTEMKNKMKSQVIVAATEMKNEMKGQVIVRNQTAVLELNIGKSENRGGTGRAEFIR